MDEALAVLHDLQLETQAQRLLVLERHWMHVCEARERAWEAYARGAADLAFLREGRRPEAGYDGDAALGVAHEEKKRTDKPTTVLREHPIEAMFRRGQLRPEWKPLFELFVDLCAEAAGKSAGVVNLDQFVATAGRSVPTFKTRQMEAANRKESEFFGPIRARAGEKTLAVFDVTHRFGRELNTVMSVSQLGADGRYGKRNRVGQLLQRAYQALANHHGVTAERARARFARDPDARGTMGIVNPLSDAEQAEFDSYAAERAAEQQRFEADRYQRTKDHAADLQRSRRVGDRRASPS